MYAKIKNKRGVGGWEKIANWTFASQQKMTERDESSVLRPSSRKQRWKNSPEKKADKVVICDGWMSDRNL